MKKLLTILSVATLLMSFGAFAGELGTEMSDGVICANEGKGLVSFSDNTKVVKEESEISTVDQDA